MRQQQNNPCDFSAKGSKLPLADIVELYLAHCSELTERVHRQFAAITDLAECIDRASRALVAFEAGTYEVIDPSNVSDRLVVKVHPHQRLTRKAGREMMAMRLAERVDEIEECKTFEGLYQVIENARNAEPKVLGVGPIYVYDTAMRIGSHQKLRLRPKDVYLHSHPMVSARLILGRSVASPCPKGEFPKALQELEAWQIEDLLCIYRERIQRD